MLDARRTCVIALPGSGVADGMFVPIVDADVPAVVALMNRAYRGAAGWTTEQAYISGDRTTESLLRADLRAKPDAQLLKWVEPAGSDPSGCVWLEPATGGTWYLGSLTIDPARQNSGLGKTLLAAAEDWVRARGGSRVRMTVVNVRAPLIAWYRRRGYELTGEVEPFPYDDDRFGRPLRDDLSFVVLEKDLAAETPVAGDGGLQKPLNPDADFALRSR